MSMRNPNRVGVPLVCMRASWENGVSRAGRPGARNGSREEGGPREGIKVHGHWTIVVKNPDGTVAQRREFDNDLAGDSARTGLIRLLLRQATPDDARAQ